MPPTRSRSKNGMESIKKRSQKATAPAPMSGNSAGYSTDGEQSGSETYPLSDTVAGGGDRRRRRRPSKERGSKSEGKGSVIMMVLMIGLLFCLMDAIYIGRVLDRPGWAYTSRSNTNNNSETSSSSTSGGIRNTQQQQEQATNSKIDNIPGKKVMTNEEREAIVQAREKDLTPEERKARQKARREKRLAEEKVAEIKRLANIKQAAREALMAANGGKMPEGYDPEIEDEQFKLRSMDYYKEQSVKDDKERILQLFIEAGLKDMDDATYAALPKWSDVTKMYGNEPRILGLEKCQAFQNKGNRWDHFVSTAGTFNSGTNLMAEMLIHNCHMQDRMDKLGAQNRGVRWQVPWGKHTPPGDEQYRVEHKSKKDQNVDANMILPAVTIRDPYYWMQSMCKHHYTAAWRASDRCPNLIPSEQDQANMPSLRGKDFFPLSVRYADFVRHHQSLTGLWNDWYNEYKGVEFEHLFVRYEDLLFHPKNVTETVCFCAGGKMNKGNFKYVVDSAKKGKGAHGKVRTGYIDAIIKYGSDRNRYNGYGKADLKYAREHLDETMMREFGYQYHPMGKLGECFLCVVVCF